MGASIGARPVVASEGTHSIPPHLHVVIAGRRCARATGARRQLAFWRALGYRSSSFSDSASFHEQREGGDIGRRNVGIDTGAKAAWASLGYQHHLDADSLRLADAWLWADLSLVERLSLSIEYLHTEPALWLSRQSVLSVFSTDRFDEAGGIATLALCRALRLEGSAFLTIYDEHRLGARSEGTVRLTPDERSLVRLRACERSRHTTATTHCERYLWRWPVSPHARGSRRAGPRTGPGHASGRYSSTLARVDLGKDLGTCRPPRVDRRRHLAVPARAGSRSTP